MSENLTTMADSVLETIRIFDTSKMAPKTQAVLGLKALGFNAEQICQLLGYKDTSAVRQLLKRHDPNRDIERADAMQRLVLIGMARHIAFRSLLKVFSAPDYETLGAEAQMRMASAAARFCKDLQPPARLEAKVEENELMKRLMGAKVVEVEA